MTVLTFFLILVLIVFAAALMLAAHILAFEYATSRNLEIQAAALQNWFGDDDEDEDQDDSNPILDYSQLPSSGI